MPAPRADLIALDILVVIAMGFLFGFFFERSHVYEPFVIREQFIFKTFIMLKMFMGAVCGACLSFFIWYKIDPERMAKVREAKTFGASSGPGRVALGGAILGCGMVVGGACPGMVLPQVGTGVHNAWVTLLGGFTGALLANVFLAVEKKMKVGDSGAAASSTGGDADAKGGAAAVEEKPEAAEVGAAGAAPAPVAGEDKYTVAADPTKSANAGEEKTTAAEASKSASACAPTEEKMRLQYADLRFKVPFPTALAAFGLFAFLFCLVFEIVLPYKDELHNHPKGTLEEFAKQSYKDHAWPPSLCGFAIGLVNLGSIYVGARPIGSSTGYAQVVFLDKITGVKGYGETLRPYERFRLLAYYWQVPYLVTSVLGAYVSASLADNLPSEAVGIQSKLTAFLGGVLMLFGSRLGAGCTSGHGIAGMPLLNLYAIGAVCTMFAAGICVAVGLELADELTPYN